MSRRTSARLASKSTLQKRPLEPDDTPIDDDDTPVANDAEIDDEYVPHNVRKKNNTPRKKKVKRAQKFDPSLLPNELLRSIFQYCQPKMLGTLMRVCKKFEFVLRTDESIWRKVRERCYPGLVFEKEDVNEDGNVDANSPTQLPLGLTEQKVMSLFLGKSCTVCSGKQSSHVLWRFGVRLCRSCVKPQFMYQCGVMHHIENERVFGKAEIQKLVTIIPHSDNPEFHMPCYSLTAVQEVLHMAMEKRHEMTGSEFQAWLAERENECDKMDEAEEHFVGWQLGYEDKEKNEALQKKVNAHIARTNQIYEYCENLDPPIDRDTLRRLPTFVGEMREWNRRTAPLSLEAFSNNVYFKRGIPRVSEHRNSENRDVVARSSLRDILLLEVKQLRKAQAIALAKRRCITAFDLEFASHFKDLKIKSLPPSSISTIFLLDKSIEAWTRQNLELRIDEFDFLDCFMRKMALCWPQGGDRIYNVEQYDRVSVVYCGFCNDPSSARNPMSLKQANDHLAFFHKKELWKPGMLRQSPLGQPVYDGRCKSCADVVLVAAEPHETKSGVTCKNCLHKWCFKCMDKHVWVGADFQKDGVIHKAKGAIYLCRLCRQLQI